MNTLDMQEVNSIKAVKKTLENIIDRYMPAVQYEAITAAIQALTAATETDYYDVAGALAMAENRINRIRNISDSEWNKPRENVAFGKSVDMADMVKSQEQATADHNFCTYSRPSIAKYISKAGA